MLIISHPTLSPTRTSENDFDGQETLEMQAKKDRMYQNLVQWCESFGPVKHIDERVDGLHIHWKDWESAETVSLLSRFEFNLGESW